MKQNAESEKIQKTNQKREKTQVNKISDQKGDLAL
jgi:hypothetical protein